MLLAHALASAGAQELTLHPGWLLEPQAGTFYENGIGSPTVAYDPDQDLWVMYFETQYGPIEAGGDCRQGRWGIGRATSPDGLNWTIDPAMVIEPQADTFYECIAAHPTVVYDGDTWRVWFKAHQTNTVCDGEDVPDWGCGVITGVGQAESSDGITFTVTEEPIINLGTFGFPTVARVDGNWRMLLAYSNAADNIYELWQSVSTNGGDTWSTPTFVLGPGFATWVEDEIYNPAMTCDDDGDFRYTLWAGGRDTESLGGPPTVQTAGIGRVFSDDAVSWLWDGTEPLLLWDLAPEPPAVADRDWRHWDVLRVGDEFLLFYSEKDPSGRNRVGLAYTYDAEQTTLDEAAIGNRICGTEPVDTDTDVDTDDTDDATTPTPEPMDTADTDPTSAPEPDPDCGCRTTGSAGWLFLLPLLAVRRRR
jgi:hypothetical protein